MNTIDISTELYINPNQMSYEEYLENEDNYAGEYWQDPLEFLIAEEEMQ